MHPVWQIPLGQPPTVVAIGPNVHGFPHIERYCLNAWSMHLYGYDAVLLLDGVEVAVRPGTLGITPPGVHTEYHYRGVSPHLYVHFHLYAGDVRRVSAITDLGGSYDHFYKELYDASGHFHEEPTWTSSRVWTCLWKAVASHGESPPTSAPVHRAVRLATYSIEQNLNGHISVEELARKVDISPGYLTRLFQEAYGDSVAGYIRRRRMERASDLLLRSDLPIKLVASAVGFQDLQHFNKAMRSFFGHGPRDWRSQRQT